MEMMGVSLQFSVIHNIIHLATGLVGLALRYTSDGKYAREFPQIFGVIYTLVAVLGFAHLPGFVVSMLNLNTAYNLIHLILGVLGLLAGFTSSARKPATA